MDLSGSRNLEDYVDVSQGGWSVINNLLIPNKRDKCCNKPCMLPADVTSAVSNFMEVHIEKKEHLEGIKILSYFQIQKNHLQW